MKEGPDISRIAALIGDPARANILSALMGGKALTATELSVEAGVTASTTSIHLGKLEAGGLIARARQGRHRYYTLAGPEVAQVLEQLMGLAQRTGATRVRTGPRDPELRHARICYDHLAGEMGVALLDGLLSRGLVARAGEALELTPTGRASLEGFGIDIAALARTRRKMCRGCLDWSMRRDHLAGGVGAAIWSRMADLGWAQIKGDTRVITFTPAGLRDFDKTFRARPA